MAFMSIALPGIRHGNCSPTLVIRNAAAGNSYLVSQNIFWSAGVKF